MDAASEDLALVYLNQARPANEPGAHALVIGIGNYVSSGIASLTSPAVSARTIAGWMMGKMPDGVAPSGTGFNNPHKPLASLAILLSEPNEDGAKLTATDGVMANFAGVRVPRASLSNIKAATIAWIARARQNPENVAVLYICAHGLRDENRTAILCEDRDEAGEVVTNGLIDVDSFRMRMMRVQVKHQLLMFDCCRSETPLSLPDPSSLGEPLIDQFAAKSGFNCKQQAIFAALPGQEARGRTKNTSYFAEALVRTLDHAGATTEKGYWQVTTMGLLKMLIRCLELRAGTDPDCQRIGGSADSDFQFHIPTISANDVPTYVNMADQKLWGEAEIFISRSENDKEPLVKASGDPFVVTHVPRDGPVNFIAKFDNRSISTNVPMPGRPVLFVAIGDPDLSTVSVAEIARPVDRGMGKFGDLAAPDESIFWFDIAKKNASPFNSTTGMPDFQDGQSNDAEILITLAATPEPSGAIPKPAGAIVAMSYLDFDQVGETFCIAESATLRVRPGRYALHLSLPDGRTLDQRVSVAALQRITVNFQIGGSRHEWLQVASFSGALPPSLRQRAGASASTFKVTAHPVSPLQFKPAEDEAANFGAEIRSYASDDAVVRFNITDNVGIRFRKETDGSLSQCPLWARVEKDGQRFTLATASIGKNADPRWEPHLIAFDEAGRLRVASLVEQGAWTSFMAFLGRREFSDARVALDGLLSDERERERILGLSNAILSAAAAIAMIAAGAPAKGFERSWFEKFVAMRPSLADAKVILARSLLAGDYDDATRDQARNLLCGAYSLGVPMFSLCLDWLGEGLDIFDDLQAMSFAARAKAFARRNDSRSLFTCIREDEHQS